MRIDRLTGGNGLDGNDPTPIWSDLVSSAHSKFFMIELQCEIFPETGG